MNILIPLCGKGERFAKKGYTEQKPLIRVLGKEILRYTIDSLRLTPEDSLYIIVNQRTSNGISTILKDYPNAQLIVLPSETIGASETIAHAIPHIKNHTLPTLLVDGDNFYTMDILSDIRINPTKNQVVCFETKDENPIFSYVKTVKDSTEINEIAEKRKISNLANTGAYYFASTSILLEATTYVTNNALQNQEPYISHAIAHTLPTTKWHALQIPKGAYHSLGTPEQVEEYKQATTAYLFDLDGTLVQTDEAYFQVWKEILADFNITLTQEIYDTYIFSNADADVKHKLFPTASITITELTARKDALFLQHLHQIQTIAGAQDFINTLHVQAQKIAVVTNSNRKTAEAILKHINVKPELLIIGAECAAGKPSPEPYIAAVKAFDISPSKCVVFEDSKNGIISARGASVRCVVGIANSTNISIHADADIVINDYKSITPQQITSFTPKQKPNYEEIIYRSLKAKYEITDIVVSPIYLKGGFIADVLSVDMILDKTPTKAILKLMSENDSALNKMAHFLNLYDRENYFYESIAPFVPINTPKCYGILRDDNFKPLGFILEDLRSKATINKNLSTESIDLTLEVIANMAKLHAAFWNKPLKANFSYLRKHNDTLYQPSWQNFIQEKLPQFQARWKQILSPHQLSTCQKIANNFNQIQDKLSESPLTLCHGDIKSPNIFYEGSTPHFIDWQYIAHGKGVQDLIFFIIESFNKERGVELYPLFKSYYYTKLKEFGLRNYSEKQYDEDIQAALCHFPFFVAIWFGTTPTADLIDVNFPYFFIQKLFSFYDNFLE